MSGIQGCGGSQTSFSGASNTSGAETGLDLDVEVDMDSSDLAPTTQEGFLAQAEGVYAENVQMLGMEATEV